MSFFKSQRRKGSSVPFGEFFLNEYTYTINGLLFLSLGVISIIRKGYNDITLRRTYDWSQRIWLIYGIILIAIAMMIYEVKYRLFLYFIYFVLFYK